MIAFAKQLQVMPGFCARRYQKELPYICLFLKFNEHSVNSPENSLNPMADMDSTILFSERQRFRQIWIWLFLLLLNGYFLFKLFNHPADSQPFNNHFLPPAIVMLLVTFLFVVIRLDTQIRQDGVYVRFFPVQIGRAHV